MNDALNHGWDAGKTAFNDGWTVEKAVARLHPVKAYIKLFAGDACFPVFLANNIASYRRTSSVAKIKRQLTVVN